jgi:DNA-binding NtrC family response regulator
LDEIGDLDVTTQAKILRALENGEIQRIGSPENIKVDVRLICATNCDLKQLIEDNKFREDLYFRLRSVVINLPPLEQRREDIPALIDYFIQKLNTDKNYPIKLFEKDAYDCLLRLEWKGNVRELYNTVEALIATTHSSYISLEDVTKYLGDGNGFRRFQDLNELSLNERLKQYESQMIIEALTQTEYNISAASRLLQTDRNNLRKKIKILGIDIDLLKDSD